MIGKKEYVSPEIKKISEAEAKRKTSRGSEPLSVEVRPGVRKVKREKVEKWKEEKRLKGKDLEAYYASLPGVTGPEFEDMFFGTKINWERIFKSQGLDNNEYMPPLACIDFIEEHYPEDRAILPETKVSRDLYDKVAEGLGLDPEDIRYLKNHLHFFSSIHAPIDYYNGVDGFFEFIDPQGRRIYCALDTTQNPYKDEYKADVKIMGFPDFRKDKPHYLEWIDYKGGQITHTLQTKRANWV